jgi:hypothetical protein
MFDGSLKVSALEVFRMMGPGGYYVYFLRNPETGIVFYVGASRSGARLAGHLGDTRQDNYLLQNSLKVATLRYIQLVLGKRPIFEVVVARLDKAPALEIEANMIAHIGTLAEGTGPLANMPRAWPKTSRDITFGLLALAT